MPGRDTCYAKEPNSCQNTLAQLAELRYAAISPMWPTCAAMVGNCFLAVHSLSPVDLGIFGLLIPRPFYLYPYCFIKVARLFAHFTMQSSLSDQTLPFIANQPQIDDLHTISFKKSYILNKFSDGCGTKFGIAVPSLDILYLILMHKIRIGRMFCDLTN